MRRFASLLGGAAVAALLSLPANAGSLLPMMFNGGNAAGGLTEPSQATSGCLAANGGSSTNGSCFTTLALNMDFTDATTSVGWDGSTFDAQVLSNWMGCKGASDVMFDVQSSSVPCSDFSIVTDSDGKKALEETYTLSDWNSGSGWDSGNPDGFVTSLVSTLQGGSSAFQPGTYGTIPAGYYFEYKVALTSASDTACAGVNGSAGCGAPPGIFLWGASGSGGGYLEQDPKEYYLPSSRNFADTGFNNGVGSGCTGCTYGSTDVAADYNTFDVVGLRNTVDGNGNISTCEYINNVEQLCAAATTNINSTYTKTREGLTMWTGPGSDGSSNNTYTAPISLDVEWIHVWSCPAWWQSGGSYTDGNACAGVLLGHGQ